MEGVANSSSQSTTDSGSTPAEYFRPEPKLGSIPNIPTVDLGSDDQDNLVLIVAAATMEWGIFQVVNHGIPNELIMKLQAVGKEFFELPQEVKEAYAKPLGAKTIEGYGTNIPKDNIGKKSWVEFLFHLIWPSSKVNYNFWPTNNASYRVVTEEYAKHIREVGDKLFRCLSLGLGLEEHALKEAGGGDELEYMMKINHYPPCSRSPESTFGVVAHTDLSTLTILVPNEIPGLQVLKDGKWIDAMHIPHALIIHIGDQIEIMSNGRYKSVLHRTTVDEKSTRMSWPVFLEPPEELEVGPLPELVDQDNPPKYKTKKFKDYRYCKLNKLPQ